MPQSWRKKKKKKKKEGGGGVDGVRRRERWGRKMKGGEGK
jgi:hypothetical protein